MLLPAAWADYSIGWYAIAGGGGTSTGTSGTTTYAVSGMIGQPATAAMSGGNYSVTGGFWSMISVVQMSGAPLLSIARSGNQATISWNGPAAGFLLEQSGNLNSWVSSSAGLVTNGNVISLQCRQTRAASFIVCIILKASYFELQETRMFYRLHRAFFCRALVALACAIFIGAQAAPLGHRVLRGHVPSAALRLKPQGLLEETNRLRLALGLPLRNQAELTAFLRDIYDSTSPQFHQYLKPAQFAERFGPAEEDYKAVNAFARSHGLNVVQTHANRLLLDVEGPVAAVRKAFHVDLARFEHPTEKRSFYAPKTEPWVEAGVPLEHVSGLDNYLLPRPLLVTSSKPIPTAGNTGSGPSGAFMGRDFRAAYMPGVTLDGAGQTVALVEFDTFYSNDIVHYESLAGLPPVPISTVSIDGFVGTPGGGDSEVSLDIEFAISMAPGLSQVLVYQAPYGSTSVNNDLLNQMAIDDLANQISSSWLYTIDATSDSIFQEMAAQGQSFFTASGDSGAYYPDPSPLVSESEHNDCGGDDVDDHRAGRRLGVGDGLELVRHGRRAVAFGRERGNQRDIPDSLLAAAGEYVVQPGIDHVSEFAGCGVAGGRHRFDRGEQPDAVWRGHELRGAVMGWGDGYDQPAGGAKRASAGWFFESGDLCLGRKRALRIGLSRYDQRQQYQRERRDGVFRGAGLRFVHGMGNTERASADQRLGPAGQPAAGAQGRRAVYGDEPRALGRIDANTGAEERGRSGSQLVVVAGTRLDELFRHHGECRRRPGVDRDVETETHCHEYGDGNLHGAGDGDQSRRRCRPFISGFVASRGPLIVLPGTGMAVSGPAGGPFNPASQVFLLENAAATPVMWLARSPSAYVGFYPGGGTLQGGASVPVTATLGGAASNLLISTETATLSFTDMTTGVVQTRPFSLAVGNGGFETGDFSDWTLSGDQATNYNTVGYVIPWINYVHSGASAAILGEFGSLASLSQTLPTSNSEPYLLSFWLDNLWEAIRTRLRCSGVKPTCLRKRTWANLNGPTCSLSWWGIRPRRRWNLTFGTIRMRLAWMTSA